VMASVRELEKRVAAIEQRNARVEADKAWETSWARRGLLVLFIYLAIGIYFWAIGMPYPWLNAIVPAAAFLLSTLTLAYLKGIWLGSRD
jgi:hypothetical protein